MVVKARRPGEWANTPTATLRVAVAGPPGQPSFSVAPRSRLKAMDGPSAIAGCT